MIPLAMIFDRFPDRAHAVTFAAAVALQYDLDVAVFGTATEALRADPFPCELIPPIVHIERTEDEGVEAAVEDLVVAYQGVFAGT